MSERLIVYQIRNATEPKPTTNLRKDNAMPCGPTITSVMDSQIATNAAAIVRPTRRFLITIVPLAAPGSNETHLYGVASHLGAPALLSASCQGDNDPFRIDSHHQHYAGR